MRSNQSIPKEINPEYSLERLMLKLKLQHFGHLMWRTHSLEKTLMLGKIEGKMRRGWQRMRWLESITDLRAQSLQSCPTLCDPMDHGPPGSSVHGILQAKILEWVAVSFSYHWLNGHEFEQTLGDSGGQRSLVCCSPLDHKESDKI